MFKKSKIFKIVNNNAIVFIAIFFCALFLIEKYFLNISSTNYNFLLAVEPVSTAVLAAKAAKAAKVAKAAKAAKTAKKNINATKKAASSSKSSGTLKKALSNKNNIQKNITKGAQNALSKEKEETNPSSIVPNEQNVVGETADTIFKIVMSNPTLLLILGALGLILIFVFSVFMMIQSNYDKYTKFLGFTSNSLRTDQKSEVISGYLEDFEEKDFDITEDEERVFSWIIEEYQAKYLENIEIDIMLMFLILSKENIYDKITQEQIQNLSKNMIQLYNNEHKCIEKTKVISDQLVKVHRTAMHIPNIKEDSYGTCSYENEEIIEYRVDNSTMYVYRCEYQNQIQKYFEKQLLYTYESNNIKEEKNCTINDQIVFTNKYQYSEEKVKEFLLTSKFLEELYGNNINKETFINEILEEKEFVDQKFLSNFTVQCNDLGNVDIEFLREAGKVFNSTYRITSHYGPRSLNESLDFHRGIDLAPNTNDWDVLAVAAGTVTRVVREGCYNETKGSSGGCLVIMQHLINGNKYETRYLHLANRSIPNNIKVNEKIEKGTKIGVMGNTGHSYGAHLHFDIRKNNSKDYLNPTNLFIDSTNFDSNCKVDYEEECSYESIIAALSKKNNYNYALVSSFYNSYEGSLLINFRDKDFIYENFENDIDDQNTVKVENNILYLNNKIINSSLSQEELHQSLFKISKVINNIYDFVDMGSFLINGSDFKKLRYMNSKLLFENMIKSRYYEVNEFFELINQDDILKNIFSKETFTDKDFNILETRLKKSNIKQKYETLKNTSLYEHINSCFKYYLNANWNCVYSDAEKCTPYETLYPKLDSIMLDYNLTEKESFIINTAKELNLKVISCNSSVCNTFNTLGVNGNWSSKNYGLDNAGYITWILNQVSNNINNEYIQNNNGACNVNTNITSLNNLTNLEILRPGMVLCDLNILTRNAIMYLGKDSKNIYYINSSNLGIEIQSITIEEALKNYKKYFVINY